MAEDEDTNDGEESPITPEIERHLAAIGHVAAEWAEFEFLIDIRSHTLADIGPNEGACLSAQIMGSARKLDAYISLARLRGADKRTVEKLMTFARDTAGLQEQRNRVVHDQWMIFPGGSAHRYEITARKKLIAEYIDHPTDDLKRLVQTIRRHMNRFEELAMNVRGEWQALLDRAPPSIPR